METLEPIYTADLFPELHAALIALLHGLDDDDWLRPTVAGSWRVRDIVGHLVDIDLRKLSGGRDGHRMSSRPLRSFADVVNLVNTFNASGVQFAERLSPRVLTDLLAVTGPWVSSFVASLPPEAEARIPVAWADEDRSTNWMDTGREYTERWHHQMQIREAVGAAGLLERRWLEPLLELSVRAFRRAFKDVTAADGTAVLFEVAAADTDYAWSVVRQQTAWTVLRGRAPDPAAALRVDDATSWKMLYNALSQDAVRERAAISGDATLVEPMLRARSVMV